MPYLVLLACQYLANIHERDILLFFVFPFLFFGPQYLMAGRRKNKLLSIIFVLPHVILDSSERERLYASILALLTDAKPEFYATHMAALQAFFSSDERQEYQAIGPGSVGETCTK